MKSPEEFSRDVYRKASAKRAQRKRLLTLALALPVAAAGVLAVRFGAPLLQGSKSGAAGPADYREESITEDAMEGNGRYTLEAAPARLMDVSWRAWEARREALYEEAWKDVTGNEDKETLAKLQQGLDEQLARLDEEQKTFREQAAELGLSPEQNLLDPAFGKSVTALGSKMAPLLLSGEENGCISPTSLYLALALLGQGAQGQTRQEMLSLLGTEDADWLADQCGKFIRQSYADNDVHTLMIENSLWAADRLTFAPDYLKTASEDFYTSLFRADFTDPGMGDAVSAWISQHTKGLLEPQLQFDPRTVLALVNTLYFYEEWHDEFNAENNTVEAFTLPDGKTMQTTYMHRAESQMVYFGEKFTLAALSLKGSDRMIFVLPDEGVDPGELLQDAELAAVLAGEKEGEFLYRQVEWSVPKFSLEGSYDLREALKALGMEDAFDAEKADFSGLGSVPEGPLYVSQARQDVHIGIDEQGVEAAAFTMFAMEAGAAMPPDETVEMKLDRPFLFAVAANTAVAPTAAEEYPAPVDTLLFYGVCAQPEEAE